MLHPAKKDATQLAIVRPDSEFGRQAQGKRDWYHLRRRYAPAAYWA